MRNTNGDTIIDSTATKIPGGYWKQYYAKKKKNDILDAMGKFLEKYDLSKVTQKQKTSTIL